MQGPPIRIAFLVDGLMSRYQIRLLNGAREAAHRRGAHLIGFQGSFLRRTEGERAVFDGSFLFDLARPEAVDGLLPVSTVLATTIGLAATKALCEESKLPTVSIGSLPGLPSVAIESGPSISSLVRHLVEVHGRRKIAFIRGNLNNPESVEREVAVIDTLASLGVSLNESLFVQGNFLESSGQAAVRTLVDERGFSRNDFDAIVSANDQMAAGAALALAKRQIRVPEDIAIVGFDDDDHARSTSPPLTTVAQPIERLGALAIDLLLDRIAGQQIPERTLLPTEPVLRRSCGCEWPERAHSNRLLSIGSPEQLVLSLRAVCESQSVRITRTLADERTLEMIANAAGAPDGAEGDAQLVELERELLSAATLGYDPLRWEDALVPFTADVARARATQATPAAEQALARLQRLRLLLNETAARSHALGRLHVVQHAHATRVLGSALACAKDVRALSRVLEGAIGGLGVRYCDVCLFVPRSESKAAKLIARYRGEYASSADLPHDAGELWRKLPGSLPPAPESRKSLIFPAANLLQEAPDNAETPYALLVYPLVFAEQAIGYIVYDAPASLEDAWLHENIAGHVSNAISALLKGQELRSARELAEQASATKSEFVAVMSHEIRTPLNAILGHLDLCLRGELPPEERRHASRAESAARALLEIVNDVLDFSKIEADKLDLEQVAFETAEWLTQIRNTCALSAQRKGLEFVIDVDPNLPTQLVGDPLRLNQVVVNLLSNASKFSEGGHVVLRIDVLERDPIGRTELRFEVEDTGIGMSADRLEALFNPFTQGDSSMSRRYGGTGLGLSISKRLVEMMGGTLNVESSPGRGSRFWFSAPFTEVRTRPPRADFGAGLRALIVEDSDVQARALMRFLDSHGYSVKQVASAAECVDALLAAARRGTPFDLAFVDGTLPDLRGATGLTRLVADHPELSFPVLVLCGEAADSVTVSSDGPIRATLHKPYEPMLVASLLRELSGGAQAKGVEAKPRPTLESLRGRHLLLVHDSEFSRDLAYELLVSAGASVALAMEGNAALALAREQAFDAILLDLYLPGMDGSEVATEIRKLPKHATTPLLACTASTDASDLARCRAAGMRPCPPPSAPESFLRSVALTFSSDVSPASSGARSKSSEPPLRARANAAGAELDIDAALQRLGGDLSMYRRLLKRFASSHAETADEVLHALGEGALPRAHLVVHTLNASSAAIGGRRLAQASATLEAILRAGQRSAAEAFLPEFRESLLLTLRAVQAALTASRPRAPSGTLPAVGPRPTLERLKALVDAHDTSALEGFETLRSLCATRPDLSPRLQALEAAILSYDFGCAKRELISLQAEIEEPAEESSP